MEEFSVAGAAAGGDANDPLDRAIRAFFHQSSHSPIATREPAKGVLDSLKERSSIVSEVLLRDADSEVSQVEATRRSELGPGQHSLGRYKVFGEIARGGVGAVLRGRDTDLGRDLAIKVLLATHGDNPEMARRFVEEAQIGGQLQHPGIVPVYELALDSDRRPFFTMKLVKGRTLAAQLASRGDLLDDRRRFLGIFEQVCQTVAYAHARGVVHRDLKPSNVMVGAFGEVQVMDWGLAKVLGQAWSGEKGATDVSLTDGGGIQTIRRSVTESESVAGQVMGTPAYMAPEQARGEIESTDERTDVFGLGAILCEILTGKPPHVGKTARAARSIAAAGALDDSMARIDAAMADEELKSLAKRCIAPDRNDRPRDAGVVATEIASYLASVEERARAAELSAVEARARADESVARARQERRARRLTVALATIVLLAVSLGSAGYLWVERDRRVRVDETERAVAAAMDEAFVLRGQAEASGSADPARWMEALASARRAQALARPGEVDAGTLWRVTKLRTELELGQQSALASAKRAEADQRMIERLDDARGDLAKHAWEWKSQDEDYSRAFRDHGIDLESLSPGVAAERIRSSAIAGRLVAALDEWARARRRSHAGERNAALPLMVAARAADPDAQRSRLRDACETQDFARLKEIASSPELRSFPAATLDLLGGALADAGETALAAAVYEAAVKSNPGDFWLNHELVARLAEMAPRRADDRLRYASAMLAIRPCAHAWLDLSEALQAKGVIDDAIQAVREALRLEPTRAKTLGTLGAMLQIKGDLPGAIAALREAIRLKADFIDAHASLAGALRDTGDLAGAILEVKEAIRLEPRNELAFSSLGVLLLQQGDLAGAIEAFRAALKLQPGDADASYNLGNLLAGTGDIDGAIAAFRESIRARPSAGAYSNLGAMLSQKDDMDGAVAAHRDAVRLKPDCARCQLNLGNALAWIGEAAGAMAAFESAVRLSPSLTLNAASTVGRAGCGEGTEGKALDEATRAAWRAKALEWLRAELANSLKTLDSSGPAERAAVRRMLESWTGEPELASLRVEEGLGRLPGGEGAAWRALWQSVEQAIGRTSDADDRKK